METADELLLAGVRGAVEGNLRDQGAGRADAEPPPPRRDPCRMTFGEDVLAVAYFLVILGLPVALPVATAGLVVARSPLLKWWVLLLAALALHPIPPFKDWYRRNRMGVILAKYFTMTLVFDMSHPHPMMKNLGTPAVEENPQKIAPMVPLACPHGVLNFGAIVWVFFSRWICGLEQYTAGAPVVAWVPGLRYLCASLWIIPASRKSIKRGLQEHPRTEDKDGKRIDTDVPRRGGMVGVVPDGIAGIFRSKPGSELLYIGKKRGLMRICLEEGAIIAAGWFAGTSDMFHIIQGGRRGPDPALSSGPPVPRPLVPARAPAGAVDDVLSDRAGREEGGAHRG
ncbi:unnamed protein product [Prorocentrum cordatum]|uniref:Acyltransferase n=1 Tax=Prorocentrum cordatum TaxID=2364126 RepID=A0ABN9SVK9_9DINO|nr:unnamed protein product [Polarella glacialis]